MKAEKKVNLGLGINTRRAAKRGGATTELRKSLRGGLRMKCRMRSWSKRGMPQGGCQHARKGSFVWQNKDGKISKKVCNLK